MSQQAQGEGRESEGKVELWLWELEQWVRREGPTITASCVLLQKCLHHDSVRGGCVLGLQEKTNPYESWCDTVRVYPLIVNFNADGLWGRGGEGMAGCRCWQRSELFVPTVENSKCPNGVVSFCIDDLHEDVWKGDSKRLRLHFSV